MSCTVHAVIITDSSGVILWQHVNVIYLYLLHCRRGGKGRGGGVRHIEAGKEAAMEAEIQASRERAVIPVETRIQQFMEMLAEKEVMLLFGF